MKKSIIKKFLSFTAIAFIPLLCGSSIRNVSTSTINITPKQKISLNDNFFVDIVAGDFHSLALDSLGNLWTWGRNDKGQLGNGTTVNSTSPQQIMRGHKFLKISADSNNSAAIDMEGKLFIWGNGNNTPLKFDDNVYEDVHFANNKVCPSKNGSNKICIGESQYGFSYEAAYVKNTWRSPSENYYSEPYLENSNEFFSLG